MLKNPWEYSPIGQRLVDHIYDQKSPDGRLSALTALVRDLKRQAQRDVRLIVDTHAPSWQREQPLRKRAPPQKSTEEQLDEKVRRVRFQGSPTASSSGETGSAAEANAKSVGESRDVEDDTITKSGADGEGQPRRSDWEEKRVNHYYCLDRPFGPLGGTKFIKDGVYYTVGVPSSEIMSDSTWAVAQEWEYAAKQLALKQRGADILYRYSMNRASNDNRTDLVVNMYFTVDYRGFRVLAEPVLPLQGADMVYGLIECESAPSKAINNDRNLSDWAKAAAEHLHVSKHTVDGVDLYFHGKCFRKDGRYYWIQSRFWAPTEAIDVARHLPKLPPRHATRRTLRPELMSHCKERGVGRLRAAGHVAPVQDGRSTDPAESVEWKDPDDADTNRRSATQQMVYIMVGKLAHHLMRPLVSGEKLSDGWPSSIAMSSVFHRFGMPMRHLGLVWKHTRLTDPRVRMRLVAEMVARVLKQYLRERLRTCARDAVPQIVAELLNLVCGQSANTISFWEDLVGRRLHKKFGTKRFMLSDRHWKLLLQEREEIIDLGDAKKRTVSLHKLQCFFSPEIVRFIERLAGTRDGNQTLSFAFVDEQCELAKEVLREEREAKILREQLERMQDSSQWMPYAHIPPFEEVDVTRADAQTTHFRRRIPTPAESLNQMTSYRAARIHKRLVINYVLEGSGLAADLTAEFWRAVDKSMLPPPGVSGGRSAVSSKSPARVGQVFDARLVQGLVPEATVRNMACYEKGVLEWELQSASARLDNCVPFERDTGETNRDRQPERRMPRLTSGEAWANLVSRGNLERALEALQNMRGAEASSPPCEFLERALPMLLRVEPWRGEGKGRPSPDWGIELIRLLAQTRLREGRSKPRAKNLVQKRDADQAGSRPARLPPILRKSLSRKRTDRRVSPRNASGSEKLPQSQPSTETPLFQQCVRFAEHLRRGLAQWVSELSVSRMGLSEVPKNIGDLSSLGMLDLSDNKLTSLPIEIGKLQQLRSLDVRRNQLKRLPAEISGCAALQTLRASHNLIRTIPRDILSELQRLETLDLGHNRIKYVPMEVADCGALRTVDLSHNQLMELAEEMAELKVLDTLDLRHNPDLVEIPGEVRELRSLRNLRVDGAVAFKACAAVL